MASAPGRHNFGHAKHRLAESRTTVTSTTRASATASIPVVSASPMCEAHCGHSSQNSKDAPRLSTPTMQPGHQPHLNRQQQQQQQQRQQQRHDTNVKAEFW